MLKWVGEIKRRYIESVRQLVAFRKNPAETWSQLAAPEDEWQVIKEMAIWAVPSAVARCLCWGYWHFGIALFKALLWYILLFLLMVGIGKLITLLAILFETEIDDSRSMQLSFLSFLPLLIGGLLYVNPLLGVLAPFTLAFGLYILYHGVMVQFLSLKNKTLFLVIIGFAMILGIWVLGALTGGLFLPKYLP